MFNESGKGPAPERLGHADTLNTLAAARPERLKVLAEELLARLGDIRVIANRTGLVMMPMRDTVKNVDFHLGEVLVSEAHIADTEGRVGYGMTVGRDLERAMAMAVVDLFLAMHGGDDRVTAFLAEESTYRAVLDAERMRQVEATRVEMETF